MAKGRFAGKTALLTGAAGDIGFAVAQRILSEGASVALLDMNGSKLEDTKKKLLASAGAAAAVEIVVANIAIASEVEKAVDQVVKRFGSIEILYNNAGVQGEFKPVHLHTEKEFEKVMTINVVGSFHVLKTVAAHMVKRRYGRIVNVASMAGVSGAPNMPAYSASKAAILGLTLTAAKDLAPYNIRINAISPGFLGPGVLWDRQVELQSSTNTQYYSTDPKETAKQMIGSVPMRRCGAISEIPGTVLFLLSDDSSYITGINIPIVGGGS